jgi:ATP-dependent Clp protease ATP-binding subunit ClpA
MKIIQLRLEEFAGHIAHNNYKVQFSDSVTKHLLDLSKAEHGLNATIINRLMTKYIEPVVADSILEINSSSTNNKIFIDIKDGNLLATIKTTSLEGKTGKTKKQKSKETIG